VPHGSASSVGLWDKVGYMALVHEDGDTARVVAAWLLATVDGPLSVVAQAFAE
jgi:hypothetical protein